MIQRNANWVPLEFARDDPVSVEAAWRAWAAHEMAKRGLWMSHLHDMTHLIAFALPTCYLQSELMMHLPCDDALWSARSAPEWLAVLQRSSPYGTLLNFQRKQMPDALLREGLRQRLTGLPMQYTLEVLRTARGSAADRERVKEVVLNPMAAMPVIKVLLADVYALCTPGGRPEAPRAGAGEDVVYTLQYALHNWLTAWLAGPDTPRETEGARPAFHTDLLPFYWLAQITLVACQERMPPFAPGGLQDSDMRFEMVSRWLRAIRTFLKKHRGEEGGGRTVVWDEMMKIKLEGYRTDRAGIEKERQGFEGGVLEFFGGTD